jgi:hypothetical protein
MNVFSPKDPREVDTFTVDFRNLLATGETIQSATWACEVLKGNDAAPTVMIIGSADINGTNVSQQITGGVAGVTYLLSCLAVTSAGNTLVGSGSLVVQKGGA